MRLDLKICMNKSYLNLIFEKDVDWEGRDRS